MVTQFWWEAPDPFKWTGHLKTIVTTCHMSICCYVAISLHKVLTVFDRLCHVLRCASYAELHVL